MIEFIYKNLRHTEYRLPCSQRIKEKVTRYFKQRYLHFGKHSLYGYETRRRQVVWYSQGVEYKGMIIPVGTNTQHLNKHLNEIHL